jgi:hypothetical protein
MNRFLRLVSKIQQMFKIKYTDGGFIKPLTPDEQTKMSIYVSDCSVISKEMADKLDAKFFENLNNIKKYGENAGLVGRNPQLDEFLINMESIKWLTKK